jgi:hypothetical protein
VKNQTVPTLTIVLSAVTLMLGFPTTLVVTYAVDSSSITNTEQALKQKNVGVGESTNINCAENLISTATSIICPNIENGPDPDPDPDPDPEPGAPTIEIRSVHCTELTATEMGVAVEFTIFGIEHDSEQLTFTVLVISSEGVEHIAEITIPANAPNPATTFIGFSLPLQEGEHTILAFINGEEVRETFVAPSCLE